MAKAVPAFLRAEIGHDATDPTQESHNCMLGRLAQMRLDLLKASSTALRSGEYFGRFLRDLNQDPRSYRGTRGYAKIVALNIIAMLRRE